MFHQYARRLLVAVVGLPALAAALPGRAAADGLPAPTVTLRQQGVNIVANWTAAVSYDSYNVKWTARGRPGSDTAPGGTQGTAYIGQFVRGTDVLVQVQGVQVIGGVPVLSPWSDPQEIFANPPVAPFHVR